MVDGYSLNMIKTMIFPHELGWATISDVQGGQMVTVTKNQITFDNLAWLEKFRHEQEAEAKLRETSPALQSMYEQYRVMLAVIKEP